MTSGARLAALVAALLTRERVAARARRRTVPEVRLDGIVAHRGALQAALGLDIPISSAMRLELAAGAGRRSPPAPARHVSARADAIVHFLLDPRHLMRWSPYAGGGIGARYDRSQPWRAVAILVVGVNAPKWKHAAPFIEAGLGGGFRIGAGLRRAEPTSQNERSPHALSAGAVRQTAGSSEIRQPSRRRLARFRFAT